MPHCKDCGQCAARTAHCAASAAATRTLRDLKPGESGTVSALLGEGALKRRIMDMGVTRGVRVFVRKVAPLGDPIEINLRGYELTLRKEDAARILLAERCV